MKTKTKLTAIGAVAVLAMAGVAIMMMGPNHVSATDSGTPVVTMSAPADGTEGDQLSLQVTTMTNGQQAPLSGAEVAICTMSVVREQDRSTFRVMNVTDGRTDANGTFAFGTPQGKYFAYAYSNGLRGLCQGNLTDDEFGMVKAHQWNWSHMEGEVYQCMHQYQIGSSTATMAQNGDCAMDRDRDCRRDGSCDGTPLMTGPTDRQDD